MLYKLVPIYFCACIHWSHPCPVWVIWLFTCVNEDNNRSWSLQVTAEAGAYWNGPDWRGAMTGMWRDAEAELNRSRMLNFSMALGTGGMRDLIMTEATCTHPQLLCFLASSMATPIWISNNIFGLPKIYWGDLWWADSVIK